MHASRIAPSVIEVEKRAHGDGVVECLVRPTRALDPLDVLSAKLIRVTIHLFQESEESLLRVRQG